MNFLDAINAHVMWKVRLQKYLNGTSEENLDPEHICKDNQCPLGKWIYGNSERYNKSPIFEEVRTKHAEFHITASKIVQLVNTDRKTEAEEILHGDYTELSRRLQTHIRSMARDLNFQS